MVELKSSISESRDQNPLSVLFGRRELVFLFCGVCFSVQQIRKRLEDVSSRDHSAYDAFVLVILSHGNENGVYGLDGNICKDDSKKSGFVSLDDITTLFNGTNCRSLSAKPKLFFIQACQGGEYLPVFGCAFR